MLDAVEDGIGQPIGAQELPDILDRVQFGCARRQKDQADVARHFELGGGVPPCSIEQHDGMSASCHATRDFLDMQLHAGRAGEWERQASGFAARRADRPEQPGVVVALVGWLAWPRASPGPLPDDAVLLADPGLVLEPDLDRLSLRQMAGVGAQDAGEVFLNASMTAGSCPG